MALTHNSLMELVKEESQGIVLRSLGELTSHRQSISVAAVRGLLNNLTSLRVLFNFVGAVKPSELSAALHQLLDGFQFGQITRGRAVLDLSKRVFTRLVDATSNLEALSALGGRSRLRARTIRTSDLEQELARMLNLESLPRGSSLVNITAPSLYRSAFAPYARRGADEGCYVTLTAFDLLKNGEQIRDMLPILGSLTERGMLFETGLFDEQPTKRRSTAAEERQNGVAFLVVRTELPWEPTGSFSRLPLMKVATLYDPAADSNGGDPANRALELGPELIAAALAGHVETPGEGGAPESTALVPIAETAVSLQETPSRRRRGERPTRPHRERRTSIGFKLISITSVIVVVSLTTMILIASKFFRDDITVRIEENNHNLAQVTALSVEKQFQSTVSQTQLFLTMVSRFDGVPGAAHTLESAFFAQNTGIGYVGTPGQTGFYNDSLLEGRQLSDTDIQDAIAEQQAALTEASSGTISVVNLSPQLKTQMLAVVMPFRENNAQVPLVIVTALDPFVQAVQTSGITQTFAVNAQGQLVIDPDLTLLEGTIDYSKLPIVAAMLKSPIDNGELQYTGADGVHYLASFKRTTFAGLGVITAAPTKRAFEAVRAIQERNLYLMGIVLALAILFIYFFSKTLTRPVRHLVEAARQVEGGNFLLELRPTTRDELGLLTLSFVQMGRGLHERERIKDAFGKFVSKSMAEQVLQGDVRLGGERKAATIFFSDIRSFTAISEQLQPEEVVEFLNEYMSRMVECVNETGGVVDKFIGDAIMAVWGLPVSRGNDAEHAINGALMMRTALLEFNRDRGSQTRPIIRIGCGINSGPVVAGQIGSTERMEYTVIGDPVNLASRIEALNKPFGTDILISSDTHDLIQDIFDVVPQLKIKVKGKSEPQQIYAVLGRKDDLHRPKNLRELQRLIGVDPSSLKKKSNLEEEVKYDILDQ
ncbi:MAG TPA: adenylate/guanylate cyclase domain-containing protein [Spirochaetia bacterium]|nr:adenylate/guanylate cyclase domain-containing protein [Spirochaetia bacterium]